MLSATSVVVKGTLAPIHPGLGAGRSQALRCAAAALPEPGRRQLLAGVSFLAAGRVVQPSVTRADDASVPTLEVIRASDKVYLDVKLEGKALGRIVVQLFPDVTVGSARFRDLSIGKEGVGYRLARFDGIFPTYIRCEGATTLSYSATGDSPIAGGASLEALERELEVQSRSHQGPGLVSLVVRDPVERPTQEKLVARNGQLVTMVIEAGGLAANGTTFTITRMPESSLDRTNLIVGQVVEGQDVVDAIGALPFARPRDSYFDGPFFAAAKAMGDKRATTAEKGFNRPLKRVIVSGGGLV
ncbi:hypothetical protein V8C86DRAFT_2878728 [Haematococcus lacustris]